MARAAEAAAMAADGGASAAVVAGGDSSGGGGDGPLTVSNVRALFPLCPSDAPTLGDVPPLSLLSPCYRVSAVRWMAVGGVDDVPWRQRVKDAVLKANAGAAPGVSGVRMTVLREMVGVDGGLAMVSGWVDGLLGGGGGAMLGSARLRMIEKPGGKGWRPLGIGEALGVVAKKVALEAMLAEGARVALENGGQWLLEADSCKLLGGRLRSVSDVSCGLVALDVKNAFNSVFRSSVVECVMDVCPRVAPFVQHCLVKSAAVFVEELGEEVAVDRGVVQGDPMSSVLFALVMCSVVRRVVDRLGSVVEVVVLGPKAFGRTELYKVTEGGAVGLAMYADDVTLVWPPRGCGVDVVVKVVEVLDEELGRVGLTRAPQKTVVVAQQQAAMGVKVAAALGGVVKDAHKFVGVPIGKVEDARGLLRESVAKAGEALRGAQQLGKPMAEVALLAHAGVGAQLQWPLEACGPGVVSREVLDEVATLEGELMRHVFGEFAGEVTEGHLKMVARRVCDGGIGWERVDDIGCVGENGLWKRRSAQQRVEWEKVKTAELDVWLRDHDDPTLRRRVAELRAGVELWWENSVWLNVWDDRGNARVESMALALGFGVKCVPASLVGSLCPFTHSPPKPLHNALSCHYEQCGVKVTHPRHDATVSQLVRELKYVVPSSVSLDREMGVNVRGDIVPRSGEAGASVVGDVYVRGGDGAGWGAAHVFLDVGWRGVMTTQVTLATDAAGGVWKAKWDGVQGTNVLRGGDRAFVPVAVSTSGRVEPRSKAARGLRALPNNAWRRIVAAGMKAQAQGAVAILEAASGAGAVQLAAIDGRAVVVGPNPVAGRRHVR